MPLPLAGVLSTFYSLVLVLEAVSSGVEYFPLFGTVRFFSRLWVVIFSP